MSLLLMLSVIEAPEEKQRFEEIYFKYKEFAYNVAKEKLNGDETYAEEAAQNVFFYIANNFKKVKTDNERMLRSYIYRIAKSEAYKIARSNSLRIESLESIKLEPQEPISPEEIVIGNEDEQRLINAIRELPDIYRTVLVLNILHSITPKEIAKIQNVKTSTVYTQLSRGRKFLEEKLEELFDEIKS